MFVIVTRRKKPLQATTQLHIFSLELGGDWTKYACIYSDREKCLTRQQQNNKIAQAPFSSESITDCPFPI